MGLFDKIFSKPTSQPQGQMLKMLNSFTPIFTAFGGDIYASDTVRSAIHTIASAGAKLNAKHIRRVNKIIETLESTTIKMLRDRPNPYMSGYDFLYKTITQLLLRNNVFVYVDWDGPRLRGFYPLPFTAAEFIEVPGDPEIWIRFKFASGQTMAAPYSEVIHIRRYFADNDLLGDSNDVALLPTLELVNTTNQGIINAIKSSAYIRGLLKYTQNLNPTDLKKQRDAFIADYMDATNNGGVAALDAKAEYIPLNSSPVLINGQQMKLIEDKVYKYFGLNEKIITGAYTEDEWNAFYESVIEPLAIQLSQEFTNKLFTARETQVGHEIFFESNKLQYASIKTKLELREMVDRGAMTPNEWRETFNMAPVEGGDVPIRRLDTAQVSDQKTEGGGNSDNQ